MRTFQRQTYSELLDSASRINVLQLASKKRMAFTANVDLELFADAPSNERIPATASDLRFDVVWMGI